METAIEVIRWSGLIAALLLTLVVLKQAMTVVKTLADIRTLAEWIRDAAVGAADGVAAVEGLDDIAEPLERLRGAGADVAAAARRTARSVEEAAGGAADGAEERT